MRAVVVEIEKGDPQEFAHLVAYVASEMDRGSSASDPLDPVQWAIVEDAPDMAEVAI